MGEAILFTAPSDILSDLLKESVLAEIRLSRGKRSLLGEVGVGGWSLKELRELESTRRNAHGFHEVTWSHLK